MLSLLGITSKHIIHDCSRSGTLVKVTTVLPHGLGTGNVVTLTGTTLYNGTWTVTLVSPTVVTLQGSTWTSGTVGGWWA